MSWISTFLMAGALVFQPAPAQESLPQESAKTTANEIFSGVIVKLTSDSVTVVRRIRGEKDVARIFAMDSQTKVEGKLQLRVRITVEVQSGEDEPRRAVHIIVR